MKKCGNINDDYVDNAENLYQVLVGILTATLWVPYLGILIFTFNKCAFDFSNYT